MDNHNKFELGKKPPKSPRSFKLSSTTTRKNSSLIKSTIKRAYRNYSRSSGSLNSNEEKQNNLLADKTIKLIHHKHKFLLLDVDLETDKIMNQHEVHLFIGYSSIVVIEDGQSINYSDLYCYYIKDDILVLIFQNVNNNEIIEKQTLQLKHIPNKNNFTLPDYLEGIKVRIDLFSKP